MHCNAVVKVMKILSYRHFLHILSWGKRKKEEQIKQTNTEIQKEFFAWFGND